MEKYVGKPLTFMAPSGKTVTIREQNGDDDATLTEMSSSSGDDKRGKETLQNYNNFVKDIVLDYGGKSYLQPADIKAMPLRDKYYILMKSRMHSNGNLVEFELQCTDCKTKQEYSVDLEEFDTDLSLGNSPDKPKAIELYPSTVSPIELSLTSGQRVKYKLLDGDSELIILEIGKTSFNSNTEYVARELSLLDGDKWVPLKRLDVFGPKAMREIKKSVKDMDTQFSLVAECDCKNCGKQRNIPLTAIPDFFSPSEI